MNTWEKVPIVYLIRRNSEDAVELAKIEMPSNLRERFLESVGHNRGVYAVEGEVKAWLRRELDGYA